jgi:predicted DNA-binding transcriptional regulator AlpA
MSTGQRAPLAYCACVTSARRPSPVVADRLLTDIEVAEWLQVSRRTLREWRANRRGGLLDGPAFVDVGGRIRYQRSAVAGYIASNTTDSGDTTDTR